MYISCSFFLLSFFRSYSVLYALMDVFCTSHIFSTTPNSPLHISRLYTYRILPHDRFPLGLGFCFRLHVLYFYQTVVTLALDMHVKLQVHKYVLGMSEAGRRAQTTTDKIRSLGNPCTRRWLGVVTFLSTGRSYGRDRIKGMSVQSPCRLCQH